MTSGDGLTQGSVVRPAEIAAQEMRVGIGVGAGGGHMEANPGRVLGERFAKWDILDDDAGTAIGGFGDKD